MITNKVSSRGVNKLNEYGFKIVWSKSNLVDDVKEAIKGCDGGIAVTYTPVVNCISAAEHIMSSILCLAKKQSLLITPYVSRIDSVTGIC